MDKQNKLETLYKSLDNLEGCEDNPIYAQRIKELRSQISEIEEI